MKNTAKILGLLLFVAIVWFSFAACEETKDELDGTTWKASFIEEGEEGEEDVTINITLTFSSPNFTMTQSMGPMNVSMSGTYSVSGSTVTLTVEGQSETATLSGNTLTLQGKTFTKQ